MIADQINEKINLGIKSDGVVLDAPIKNVGSFPINVLFNKKSYPISVQVNK